MSDFNELIMTGNLVADPEFKKVGKADLMTLRLASSNRAKKGDEWVDEPCFINCQGWNHLARRGETLKKGKKILVKGRLEQYSWKDESGKNCSILRVNMSDFHFMSPPDRNASNGRNDRNDDEDRQETRRPVATKTNNTVAKKVVQKQEDPQIPF